MRPSPSPRLRTLALPWVDLSRPLPRFPDERESARRWFRGLLWRAFPDAQTDHELAGLASVALEVSEGRVRAWLRLEHDAKLLEVAKVLTLAGIELVFRQEDAA